MKKFTSGRATVLKALVGAGLVIAATGCGSSEGGSTGPTGPTSISPSTPPPASMAATVLAIGFPAAANPSAASAEFPIDVYVDGAFAGRIDSLWTDGSACTSGAGRIQVPVGAGAHSYFAVGRKKGIWEGTATATQGSCVPRQLICSDCSSYTSGALDNFGVFRPLSGTTLQFTIRDTQCEDGDRVSVFVNDQQVFSGEEILNAPKTRTVTVKPGINNVMFRADNGTGYKGNCNFGDVNTGELTVRGADRSNVQVWELRGGANTVAHFAVVP